MPKSQEIKEKYKLDFTKTENFCAPKGTVNKGKDNPQNRQKYLPIIYLTNNLYL